MAQKSLSERPTSNSDFAWSDYKTYTRQDFLDMYPLGVSSVVSTIGTALASMVKKYGPVATVFDVFKDLSSIKKQEMVNGIYTSLTRSTSFSGVKISSKFSGYRKGSQGWFWLPANDYRVVYY